MSLKRELTLLFATAALCLPRPAAAHCRTSTEGIEEGCRPAGTNCCTLGKPTYWPNACVGWSMHALGTKFISLRSAAQTIDDAFKLWTTATCSGDGESVHPSIDLLRLPDTECGNVETLLRGPNQNVIVFRDVVWNHKDPYNVLALTTLNFDKNTGEIRGADTEFNTANIPMECPQDRSKPEASCFDGPPSAKSYDFASIAFHEAGHFLGLAHSNDPNAAMAPQYTGGNFNLRTLTVDDIAGVCTIYPPDGTRTLGFGSDAPHVPAGKCDATPLNGFASACGSDPPDGVFACAVSTPGRGSNGPLGGIAALGIAGALVARRRRRTVRPAALGGGVIVGFAIACAVSSDASASVSIAATFDELVARSRTAALVTPVEQRSVWEGRYIVTYTRAHVEDSIAGDARADTDIWIATRGGTIGNIGQQVDGEPILHVGHPIVTFLRDDIVDGKPTETSGVYIVTARAQGAFPVADDAAREARASVATTTQRVAARVATSRLTSSVAVGMLLPQRTAIPLATKALASEVLHEKTYAEARATIVDAWRRLHH